jgi:hypothetical protein
VHEELQPPGIVSMTHLASLEKPVNGFYNPETGSVK